MRKSFKELILESCFSFFNHVKNWQSTQLPNLFSSLTSFKLILAKTLNSNHDDSRGDELQIFLISNKKLWMGIFLSIVMLLILILVIRPYSIKAHDRVLLNQSQSEILKKLIIESQSLSNNKNLVPVFQDQDLIKLKQLLLSKGMKPTQLTLNSADSATINLQLNQVAYASFLDLVNEFREIWNIYPVQISIVASASPGIVNIETKLVQFRDGQNNYSSELVLN